jgi:hypothetical protein
MSAPSPAARRRDHHDDNGPLEELLRQAQRLHPSWQDPHKFHEAKSELVFGIKKLLAGSRPAPPLPPKPLGVVPVQTSAPTPVPTATPLLSPLVLALPPERFERLLNLATAPTGRYRSGSYQAHARRWCNAIDAAALAITLTPADIAWIRRQISGRKGGGWQERIARIFVNTTPHFTNLPVKPRRKRSQQKRRADRTARKGALSAPAAARVTPGA